MSTVRLTTNFGDIDLALDEAKAPKTVENFLNYVRSGHYDGTIFHRVISGFMIQGGGFDAQMGQKPTGASVQNEADNGLLNAAYTVAMARTNTRNRRRPSSSSTSPTTTSSTSRRRPCRAGATPSSGRSSGA